MGALAPLVSKVLGVKSVPIEYRQNGKQRSVEIPDVMSMSVTAIPGADPESEMWLANTHPLFPEKVAAATGGSDSVFED